MEITTFAIATTGLILASQLYEWAKIRSMDPEQRRVYEKKMRLRAASRERLTSFRQAREKRIEQERIAKERRLRQEQQIARAHHRDADVQETPFEYRVGRHANEALAIRYGIANQEKEVIEGYYYAKGGEKRRAKDRDKIRYAPAPSICVRKLEKVGESKYRVALTSYRNREVIAVIEVGTDHIKTFLPKDENWFVKHRQLEEVLKGNGSFNLKELARFHVDKAVN